MSPEIHEATPKLNPNYSMEDWSSDLPLLTMPRSFAGDDPVLG